MRFAYIAAPVLALGALGQQVSETSVMLRIPFRKLTSDQAKQVYVDRCVALVDAHFGKGHPKIEVNVQFDSVDYGKFPDRLEYRTQCNPIGYPNVSLSVDTAKALEGANPSFNDWKLCYVDDNRASDRCGY